MTLRVACLSPFSVEKVKGFFPGEAGLDVVTVPDPPAQAAVQEAVRGADLVIADRRHKHRIGEPELELMSGCRLIQQFAVGFDSIDHRAARRHGIPVANAAGYNREAVADLVIGGLIALLRSSARADREMRRGAWPVADLMGHELGALTVGIVGFGNVGSTVARRLTGFGSRIQYYDVLPKVPAPGVEATACASLDALLETSDIVCVHVPLDVDTRGLFDATRFARMKPGAIFANAARGPIHVEADLIEALRSGQLAGAYLDVFTSEPLEADSPLRGLDNVFITPHIGGATFEADRRCMEMCSENLRRVLRGEPPLHVVN